MSKIEQDQHVPVVEETATVEKRSVPGQRVRVRTKTEFVDDVVQDTLTSEEFAISRVPKNQEIDAAPEIRVEGGTVIIPVVEEVLVIEKRLVLKEELHITRCATTERVAVPIRLRKQRVQVEDSLSSAHESTTGE
jgi:stress response protein YsnF